MAPWTKTANLEDWARQAAAETGAAPENLIRETEEGIRVKPLYTAADLAGLTHLDSLPGSYPFIRGPRATMHAGRPWTIRQYGGFSTAEASNLSYRQALAAGQTGLSVAFDLATHRGYDSDHDHVDGDVGKAGVAIDTVEDMKALFDGIPLDQVSVSMTMSGAVLPVLASYIVAAEEQGVARDRLCGTIQNDILKEFMVRNTYIYPPEPSMRIVADIIGFTAADMPRFNAVSISGYHMQEAGATLVQELAFALANGREYVRAALARGLDVDAFASRLSFFFGVGMNFFMEIAKLRAGRLLWSRIMAEFAPKNPASLALRTHCQTSGISLQAQDPQTNIIRTAIEAMAAVLGGTQSLHTNGFDEALGLPSDEASRIARNTQLVLQHETGLTQVADPLAGSYYVESLTHDLAERAWTLIEEIEARGGMIRAVIDGWPKRQIEEAATRRQAAIDTGAQVIVGVNRYHSGEEATVEARSIDAEATRAGQIERLRLVKLARDGAEVARSLMDLAEAARSGGNLLEATTAAMRARATVGEVSDVLRNAFGSHDQAPAVLDRVYGAAVAAEPEMQVLKTRLAGVTAALGARPRVMVAKLGQDGHDRGARLIASAYGDLGFDVFAEPLFRTPEEIAARAAVEKVHILGVSSLAGAHCQLLPRMIQALKRLGSTATVVCGGIVPAQDHDFLHENGVAAIFGPGTTALGSASAILDLLEGRRRNS